MSSFIKFYEFGYAHVITSKFVFLFTQQDMDSSTPLILAATHGYTEIVNMLASGGCDLDQRNLEGTFVNFIFFKFQLNDNTMHTYEVEIL